MKKLLLILGEAGIELVPRELWSHKAVKSYAQKRDKSPNEILLDMSYHYSAMKKLKNWRKRGRPDIVHLCLLEALESPLNKRGMLEIYVHTYDNKIIYINSDVRLPRHYLRFIGLIEQLLIKGKVPPQAKMPLLKVREHGIRELIRELNPSKIFLLDESGHRMKIMELAERVINEEKPVLIVGAFQAGNFSKQVIDLADEIISIYEIPLTAWTVVSRVIASVEISLGIL